MSLADLAALILTANEKYTDAEEAKEAIKATFKKEFPYWSYGDWNVLVPVGTWKRILKLYNGNSAVTITQLIVELPALVNQNVN